MEFPPDYLSSVWMIVANRIRSIIRRTREPQAYVKIVLRTVKLTAFFIMLACLQVSAGTTTAQKLSLSIRNGSLESLFATIEQKTGFSVFYNAVDIQHSKPVTIDVKDASVEEVLQLSLKGQALTYFIQEKTIFIKKELPKTVSDAAGPGDAQPAFSGIVKSEAGTPLAGATVYVPKLKRSVVTGARGEFEFKNVPDGVYEVEISFVGYETITEKVTVENHAGILTAALKQSNSELDQTVVKGYYNTTERLNTGDVTTVKAEDIEKQPVSDPILALEGRVPGLYIQQASGAPGAYSKIQIRGQNSIANGNDPLYIIDGVPFSSVSLTSSQLGGGAAGYGSATFNSSGGGLSPLNNLNPTDIASIVVLKDADATAIYGSRGANGVILITTKRGKAGPTRFDLNVYTGGGEITRMMPMLNTSQYLTMRRQAYQNDGLAVPSILTNPGDYNYDIDGIWDTTRNTNWQKVLIGNTANFTNLQGSISGGNTNTQFLLGGGYSNQGTAFIGNYFDQKISTNFNLTHTSSDQKFQLQLATNYTYDNSHLPTSDFTSISVKIAPDAPALYNNGSLNWEMYNGNSTFTNPVAATLKLNQASSDNLISHLNIGYQFLPGLKLSSSFGYNHEEMYQKQLNPASAQSPPYDTYPSDRGSEYANTSFNTWIIEPQLDYQLRVGAGRMEALVGSTFQQNLINSFGQDYSGFASDALITDPLAASTVILEGVSNTLYRYNAVYGRVSYNWSDKYLINLTARRDGSSRFGPGKQFGNFGSAGVGWVFSEERFVKDNLPFLSFGKLRASYGITGNDQITDYQYLSTYTALSPTYEEITGLYPTRLTNPYFAWELVKKMEGGIELGFIKERILLSASYYRDRTGNQLVGEPLPEVAGFTTVQYNLPAVVQNTGLELTLNALIIKSKDFSWSMSDNLTVPSNKLVSFPGLNASTYANTYVVGKSLFIRELYHNTGVNPQTGLYSFETKNANGSPSYPQDNHVTKPITQKYYGGIDNKFSYKGFELDAFVQFVDQLGYNYKFDYSQEAGVFYQNQPTAVLKRWQTPGDLSSTQRFGTTYATGGPFSNFQSSDGILTNSSFVRLKNLALSYQLPAKWKSQILLQSVRIYVQCQNLFTITHFLGMDPETGGVNLPPLRMITAGLRVGF